jgi:hypothetical protein
VLSSAAGPGSLALGAVGAIVVLATGVDLFLTLFNHDGFTFVAARFQRALWRLLRAGSALLPPAWRHPALSVGSAALLPATVALWLALEITGFALMFEPGLRGGSFALKGAGASLGTAFYLSGGDLTSLTFGDVVARSGLERALVDLETVVGLSTFTLALGYVVTAFGVLGALENLHGRVRRHAEDPEQPSSILSRHFRGGDPGGLPSFLQALGEDLESYDQGLRRYPVVYYFHTRRRDRSIPRVFTALGDLVALLRWGLPAGEPMTQDPFLAALLDLYVTTLERLQRSFVGPHPLELPTPLTEAEFAAAYASAGAGADAGVAGFRELERRARASSGLEPPPDPDLGSVYERYRCWLPFAHRQRVVLDRVAVALGYRRPSLEAGGDGRRR